MCIKYENLSAGTETRSFRLKCKMMPDYFLQMNRLCERMDLDLNNTSIQSTRSGFFARKRSRDGGRGAGERETR